MHLDVDRITIGPHPGEDEDAVVGGDDRFAIQVRRRPGAVPNVPVISAAQVDFNFFFVEHEYPSAMPAHYRNRPTTALSPGMEVCELRRNYVPTSVPKTTIQRGR
jgi:hypothetical protein